MLRVLMISLTSFLLVGCATLTNDAFVPMYLSFSDGSNGNCQVTNKRMNFTTEVPGSPMIRRSDDNLQLSCETDDGRKAVASVQSTIGAELVASAVWIDFGITDSITDKHRNYPSSFVIPVSPKK